MMTVACSAAELAEDIRQAAAGRQRLIVGIVGAPGAGKSTLADQLDTLLGYDAVLVPMDGFHLANRVLADLGRQQRKSAPTFRRDLEAPQVENLKVREVAIDSSGT
jgi:pantothenate kinase